MSKLWNCVCENADIKKIEKLVKLTNPATFWDDVRNLTKNVKSDHSVKRWQILTEIRFGEINAEMKEITNDVKIRQYTFGDYIVTTEQTVEDGMDICNFYIRRKDSGFVMFVYGMPYDQPNLKEGPTVYTYEDLFEMFCANLEANIKDYEEELAEEEGR